LRNRHITVDGQRLLQRSLEAIPNVILGRINIVDGADRNTRSCWDGDIGGCVYARMFWRRRYAGYRTVRSCSRITGGTFRIELQRNDVGEVVLLHRRADLEADLSLGATHELALDEAAIL